MILAIDSSIGTAVGIASHEGSCLASVEVTDRRSHAEAIGPLIAKALAEATLTPADITAVVMGVGPGPFTGLRVGMAAAQAFAWARKIPLWPVLSHDSAAWNLSWETLVVTDARRGEVAVTRYQPQPGRELAIRVGNTTLVPQSEVPEGTSEYQGARVVMLEQIEPCQLAAAALWYQQHRVELMPAQALYLRQPDVTMPQ